LNWRLVTRSPSKYADRFPHVSASDPRLHFVLGAATTADIEIRRSVELVEKYPALAAGQLVNIREGVGIVKGRPFCILSLPF